MTDLSSAFANVHRLLKPRTPLPEIQTEFFPSVGANHSATLEDGKLRVRVSDLFVDAPARVLDALAWILLAKLYRKKIDTAHHREYRRYTLSDEMLERSRRTRSARGRRARTHGVAGQTYNLDDIFDELNEDYFECELRKPELSWTARRARSSLGRYDFSQDVIFVSRYLDSAKVPGYVIRYILYHEMLHVRFGSRISNLREIVHPPEFRREERQFEHFEAASAWLDQH